MTHAHPPQRRHTPDGARGLPQDEGSSSLARERDTTEVMLVDELALVRAGIRKLIEGFGGFRVTGETGDGRVALQMLRELRPHVVLIDFGLEGIGGHELVARISREAPETLNVLCSAHATRHHVQQAMRAGAMAYVVKSDGPYELEQALRCVLRGQRWLSPTLSQYMLGNPAQPSGAATPPRENLEVLTTRQCEVLELIAGGLSTREISDRLSLSVKTVEAHRTRIMKRVEIFDVASLTRFAIRVGLINADR